ncbi:NAD(P)-binding protein [Pleurotus eryngii]|uniref:NAD(P)-binding protein n=1 Tax=Pleurotus eryngii TaxID=5323 RepID=A0A9P6A7X6_PLEER|nr:NAD(P)-binding protein [Pleurotus eryngii]
MIELKVFGYLIYGVGLNIPSSNDSGCVLVTGVTAGIGRALAYAISDPPSKPRVIAAGRRQDRLDELASKMDTIQVNFDTDKETIKMFVDDTIAKYPDYETWFQKPETIDLDKLLSELNVNYTSTLTIIPYFLPHLLKLAADGRPCFICPVTAGLGITPGAWVANYSASKAALHSLCYSLHAYLQGTNVHIMEIIPPLVESELHDAEDTTKVLTKKWMPLEEYIPVTMDGLTKGDFQILSGVSLAGLNRSERGKDEMVMKGLEVQKSW